MIRIKQSILFIWISFLISCSNFNKIQSTDYIKEIYNQKLSLQIVNNCEVEIVNNKLKVSLKIANEVKDDIYYAKSLNLSNEKKRFPELYIQEGTDYKIVLDTMFNPSLFPYISQSKEIADAKWQMNLGYDAYQYRLIEPEIVYYIALTSYESKMIKKAISRGLSAVTFKGSFFINQHMPDEKIKWLNIDYFLESSDFGFEFFKENDVCRIIIN